MKRRDDTGSWPDDPAIDYYLRDAPRRSRLSTRAESHLLDSIQSSLYSDQARATNKARTISSAAAKDILVQNYRHLVARLAIRYRYPKGPPLATLLEEGHLALLEAIARYDASKSRGLADHITLRVTNALIRTISTGPRPRLPAAIMAELSQIRRAQEDLVSELGREPSVAEIAAHVGLTPQRLRSILKRLPDPDSLGVPVSDAFGERIPDQLSDPSFTPEEP